MSRSAVEMLVPVMDGDKLTARWLMPIERERLQGIPDNHTLVEGSTDIKRDKAVGNGMSVEVIGWILKRIELGLAR